MLLIITVVVIAVMSPCSTVLDKLIVAYLDEDISDII